MEQDMKGMHIQIQTARSPRLDAGTAVARLQTLAPAMVSYGEREGPYINIDFRAADVRVLWSAVKEQVRANAELAACSIVCCEGERGWDDYRLLHHFDPSQPVDPAE
jgi:hypothetical protein